MNNIFFTFENAEHGGVTDQLTQFSAWYKLGRSMGYEYVHNPVKGGRSGERVYDFLGFNHIWKDTLTMEDISSHKISLSLSSRQLKRQYSWGFRGLRWFVKRAVNQATRGIKNKSVVIEFKLDNPGDRKIFRLIEKSVPQLPDGIDLRKSYFDFRELYPRESQFVLDGVKVLMHMRQGDATVLPTPWGSCLAVYSTSVAEFPDIDVKVTDDLNWDEKRAMRSLLAYIDPKYYLMLFEKVIIKNIASPYSLLISSDGFGATFKRINESVEKLKLSEQNVSSINDMAAGYEETIFEGFRNLNNAELLLGESDETLFDLIHAALTADVIIASLQQKMMVKILSLYGRENNPPMMYMLHNGRVEMSDIKSFLGNKVGQVVYVDISELDD